MDLQRIIWLALAGAAGTLARYGLGGLVQRWLGAIFPWGTISINILGTFAFGVIWAMAGERSAIPAEVRVIVLIGFMGAFTTFSTFMFETGQLMRDGEYLYAVANLAIQNIVGLAFLFLGLKLGQSL